MHKAELLGHLAVAADRAVDRAIHKSRKDEFHKRHPTGQCPLCTPVQNALERSRFKDKIKDILEGLD